MKLSQRAFGYLLFLLILFNFIDAFATLHWVTEGYAYELNPFMADWMQISIEWFLFIKIFFVLIASFILWRARREKLAHLLVFLVFLLYLYVFFAHCNIAYKVFYN